MVLRGDDVHHMRTVLRMRPGDRLTVCDGARTDHDCRIVAFGAAQVSLEILSRQINQAEPPYTAILYQGLAKGDKMDAIIQKAVELGAASIVPVICQRCVAMPEPADIARKLLRWNRIAAEAAKQCGRGQIPQVAAPLAFADAVVQASRADLALIPWEQERRLSLRDALAGFAGLDRPSGTAPPIRPSLSFLIGPEGGLTEPEVELARARGIRPVSLGRRILRTETAGPAVLAMLLYRADDF